MINWILRDWGALLAEEKNCLRQLDLVLLVLVAGGRLLMRVVVLCGETEPESYSGKLEGEYPTGSGLEDELEEVQG